MKLSYQARCDLRNKVEELLGTVPYGQRIKLDEELLEQLLFERKQMVPEQYFKNYDQFLKRGFAKVPIWSGQFLRKIDLSKVSFDNVTWFAPDYPDLFEEMQHIYNFNGFVDYSYTNANIDFSSSFESKYEFSEKTMYIEKCNFAGVDLSNNDISDAMIIASDISNTGINLEKSNLYCYDSNFTGVDLANHNVSLDVFLSEVFCCKINVGEKGNFFNTKLNLVGNIEGLSVNQKKLFYTLIRNGKLTGCYLNNKLITGLEHESGTHVRRNIEYEKMRDDLFDYITNKIEEQKKSFGK